MSLLVLDLSLTVAAASLLVFNWHWTWWTIRLRRAVPGSLQQERAKRACRTSRYPGFLFWPFVIADNATAALDPSASISLRVFCSIFSLLFIYLMKKEWREFRRQIEEDDDDPWNKGKRALKRARRAVRNAMTIKVPQAAPASF